MKFLIAGLGSIGRRHLRNLRALGQEDMGWGWWWAVPVGGLFLLAIIGFRVLVQRSLEAAERADAEEPGAGH